MPGRPAIKAKIVVAALLGAAGIIALWWQFSPMLADLNPDTIRSWVEGLGVFGPLAVIALMTIAVVASPIPSAPIALAAGAAFGQIAGTFYVAIGAETGALVAFLIARILGRRTVERLLGARIEAGPLGSQNALTVAVFISRLLPFISFDVMSYAAGLSRLHLWRFLIATMAGILPASFALAYFGAEAISGRYGPAGWVALGLGLLTAIPMLVFALTRNSASRRSPHTPPKFKETK